ncbi:ROK family protein [Streptomyces sp. AJS327]|nr:ROK family protein [Streptomyces sp. AJS327]
MDVGGTKVAASVVDASGVPLGAVRLPTPAAAGPEAVLDTMAEAARGALRRAGRAAPPEAVGVSTGGVVDHATGTVVAATGLLPGWAGTAVARELSTRLGGVPVSVENDGNALALGELWFGAARTREDVLFTAVGTGVAGALLYGGELVRGTHHTAGELGHLPAPGAGETVCSCGRTGHLEGATAGPSLAARYARLAALRPAPAGDAAAPGEPPALRWIAERADAGEPLAREVLADGATVLGRTLGGLCNLFDPQAVIVSGGVSACGPAYWRPLRSAFTAELLPSVREVPLLGAELGPLAAVCGAAVLPAHAELTAARSARPSTGAAG